MEEVIRKVCPLENINPRPTPENNFKVALSILCILDRRCREHILAAVNGDVKALTGENTRNAVIYMGRSVVRSRRCAQAFTVNSSVRTMI